MAGTGTQWIEGKVQETTQGVGLTQDSHDAVAQDLQRLRLEAGDVPYAEIVRRIAHYRELNGASALTSRPARTPARTGGSRRLLARGRTPPRCPRLHRPFGPRAGALTASSWWRVLL